MPSLRKSGYAIEDASPLLDPFFRAIWIVFMVTVYFGCHGVVSVEPLVVSAGDNKDIQLPKNELTLQAYVIPKDDNGEYSYQWSLVSQPPGDQIGDMTGMNTGSLQLSKLIAGLYTFRVTVTADGKYGEASVNITVAPVARMNTAPVAVIKPTFQKVNHPNDVVLDGSESTDDDKLVKYQWEQVSGPVNSQSLEDGDMNRQMIVLKGVNPGSYKFKLTVTDSDDVQNSTFANVTVVKETDYPPKAKAGSNVIINLPQTSVSLYGNASTDDKGIVSYEWIKKPDEEDKLTADMTGVRTPVLNLEHLSIGDYTFTLKVTDAAGQESTADVQVFVKPGQNSPPVVVVTKSKTIFLPTDSATLDGSNSTDDQGIDTFTWTQISGNTVSLENADRAIATASNLKIGTYKFKLTVKDVQGTQTSVTTTVTVKANDNQTPVSDAGADQTVTLPVTLVTLDGSRSSDDRGIVSYRWTRGEKSLAAGDVLNNSDHQVVLQLTHLVAGRYVFRLEVSDAEGLTATDTASVIVKPEPSQQDFVQLRLNTDLSSFTQENKVNLEKQLALLLHSHATDDMHITIHYLDQEHGSGHMTVIFSVELVKDEAGAAKVMPGTEVVDILQQRLKSTMDIIDFQVLSLSTMVCQNNCSGHGHCDQSTKSCICEAFWMESPLHAYFGPQQSNCEWSVLYVIIVSFVSVILVGGLIWGALFFFRRWYKWRPRKRHRYTLLDELDEDADHQNDGIELLPKGKIQNTSIMVSESDFSSDEETLFINKKAKLNGHAGKNGVIRPPKTKVKT